MSTLRNTPAGAPYRPGDQVFALYATTRGIEAGYGTVLACVPAGHGEPGWTLIAEVGDLVLTYALNPAGSSPAVHRPIRRHAVDRVLPTLLHGDQACAGCLTGRATGSRPEATGSTVAAVAGRPRTERRS
jgi:hypothetical protein